MMTMINQDEKAFLDAMAVLLIISPVKTIQLAIAFAENGREPRRA